MGQGGKRVNAGRPKMYSDAEKKKYFKVVCFRLHADIYETLKAISHKKRRSMCEILESLIEEEGAANLDEKTLVYIDKQFKMKILPY